MLAIMHDDDGRTARGDESRPCIVALQAPDVVDDGGAVLKREIRNRGFHAVDGDGDAEEDEIGQHRLQAFDFLFGGDRLRAIRPG